MAVTIIATAGASNANSYATEAQARAYNDAHVSGATYTDADSDVQKRALVTATRLIDSFVTFKGYKTTSTQALEFPRTGVVDEVSGVVFDPTTVPIDVTYATSEYARLLIVQDPTKPSDVDLAGLAAMKAGDVELTFRDPTTASQSPNTATVPPSVMAYLRDFVNATASGGMTRKLTRV